MSNLPNNLYKYRLFCEGAILTVLSEHQDLGLVWSAVLQARKNNEPAFKFWIAEANHFARFCADPLKIIMMGEPVGGIQVVQPNKAAQIKADKERRNVSSSKGTVQLGKQAAKLSPKKKG